MSDDFILVEGARQNNLKGLNLRLPLGKLIVVTGVSGSGKSSLAFDTIYAEGQRRYVETFSAYTRQFLDRMDKPKVDRIEGIPPAIAIDQTNPVRTSRSTVGTMTELNDHIKLLFARAAVLHCKSCSKPVRRDSPGSIYEQLAAGLGGRTRGAAAGRGVRSGVLPPGEAPPEPEILITFPIRVLEGFSEKEVIELLAAQGYRRIHRKEGAALEVIQDRVNLSGKNRTRIVEDLEAALKYGKGCAAVYPVDEGKKTAGGGRSGSGVGLPSLRPLRFSADLHCPDCDIHYRDPVPNLFSFNSPLGACETCRGFGRTIAIDYDLVIPDGTKTLAGGAVKPWQTESNRECQDDLMEFARRGGVPADVPWERLTDAQKSWVIEGEGSWQDGKWYGVRRYFDWLESKSYRMHIRVLLSKYRTYRICPACGGARLKPDALLWRIGGGKGNTIRDIMLLSIERCREFFRDLTLPAPLDEATDLLLKEMRSRLGYLVDVGLGYLTLDRQSRTLSGGEVQRINLTTALGTSLVNTLFVLDEPSIGLHPRDIRRLIRILHRLRDAGNSLLVVEHDPDVIRASDLVLDMGPGPGKRGGEVVFFGSIEELLGCGRSLTAQYLSGKRSVPDEVAQAYRAGGKRGAPGDAVGPHDAAGSIEILGASEHNLKGIDVTVPLGRLVCVTGVSGSGKSTLVQDVLYNALRKLKHRPVEQPGTHRAVQGHELIGDVVLVDQSPIGKTTRSNPASYVGAFDAIRKLFSAEPLALERGYTPGTFSFNSGKGRCPTCGGNGFQHIEMQFLSDVYLRCPDCDGRRYRTDVLEVKLLPPSGGKVRAGKKRLETKSIADVLGMSIAEAREFFSETPEVLQTLDPLGAVGLDYLALGQPVPTLSGGEAQRLKLAGHLADQKVRRMRGARNSEQGAGTLFLFDEPTTGLHFYDIATLLKAFRALQKAGHSVVVIEHNIDVIAASDWIIDLGPEGGDGGGELVCAGTPGEVAACEQSYTGSALAEYFARKGGGPLYGERETEQDVQQPDMLPPFPHGVREPAARSLRARDRSILIRGAREHNLKNIDVRIPRESFTVVTGVSGSGKSTVAFDILFAEGQRRYLESLNAYARQFVQPVSRPDVDGVFGIPPTVAIEQRTSRGGRKSTVATATEISHFLRLLFVKLGTQHCPDCGVPIEPQTREAIVGRLLKEHRGKRVGFFAPLVTARKGYYTDLAKWALGKGFSHLRVDGTLIPTRNWPRLDRFREHTIELPVGDAVVSPGGVSIFRPLLDLALDLGKGVVRVGAVTAGGAGKKASTQTIFSINRACPRCGKSFQELDPRLFSFNSKHGWCPRCYGTGLFLPGFDEEQTGEEIWWNDWWEGPEKACPECGGRRLRREALSVRLRDRTIADFNGLSVEAAEKTFAGLKLKGREEEIARDIVAELRSRLAFLRQVGLSYLCLDRAAPTLSGGEAQRIRLASQLGSNLRGVCYVLDEPTIGLHARDNLMLLDTLATLKEKGNTVVVVEHDETTIRRAEHVVDLGPGGGVNGGRLVFEGTVSSLMENESSVTGRFLREPLRHPLIEHRRAIPGVHEAGKDENGGGTDNAGGGFVEIVGARLHNLKNLRARFPLGRLVCVTGVSGSGKSTLVRDILYENLRNLVLGRRSRRAERSKAGLVGCKEVRGSERIDRVLEVDQTPIGKTPRSCPSTYVGFWDEVRRLFASTAEAKMRGYGPSRFSFNVAGGRCVPCAGQGAKKIEMSFLPDVTVPCEVCGGKRFTPETLSARFKEKSIADVLDMSVDEAVDFFAAHSKIHHALKLLQDVGLGYIHLGQQSPTLSGGEAQRIKLITELVKARSGVPLHTLYVLDEPTIGLHMADVEKLIRVLHRLVDTGNSVVIIEHNLDVIAEADWIIDLGPEGGGGGGRLVAQGTPESLAGERNGSHTAAFLARFLEGRSAVAPG